MAINDRYTDSESGLADNGDFIINASGTDTGVVQITELGGTGDADVYREVDEGQTGTFEVSVLVDSPENEWHSQDNNLWIGDDGTGNEVRIRVTNTSGANQEYYAVGFEAGTQ